MRQHRRFAFRHLAAIRVSNRLSGDPMGQVADISVGGLRLVAPQPLAIGACYDIRLHVPEADDRERWVDISVICRWSRRDSLRQSFMIGCQLDRPSEEFTKLVAHMIARRWPRST